MNQTPDWIFNQSGVIPYREVGGELQVLLITSRKRKRWVIPKGIVETPLSPRDSAANEAWEEAGITGRVSSAAIGVYRYNKWGGTCRVQVFPMQVTDMLDQWPEVDLRDREWVSLAEAARRVDEADLKQMILALPDTLATGG